MRQFSPERPGIEEEPTAPSSSSSSASSSWGMRGSHVFLYITFFKNIYDMHGIAIQPPYNTLWKRAVRQTPVRSFTFRCQSLTKMKSLCRGHCICLSISIWTVATQITFSSSGQIHCEVRGHHAPRHIRLWYLKNFRGSFPSCGWRQEQVAGRDPKWGPLQDSGTKHCGRGRRKLSKRCFQQQVPHPTGASIFDRPWGPSPTGTVQWSYFRADTCSDSTSWQTFSWGTKLSTTTCWPRIAGSQCLFQR